MGGDAASGGGGVTLDDSEWSRFSVGVDGAARGGAPNNRDRATCGDITIH
jgi:hypothetical protein